MTMQNPQTCLSAELLRQLSHDELSPAELKDAEDHVSDCERCRQLLEVPQSDPQWRDEIVPILRSPAVACTFHVTSASGHGTWNVPATLDHDEIGSEGESLESILRLLGPTDDPHMLGRIGSYEVVGVIGRGGMGVVFKAYEGALNRFVAIKMLLPHLAASGAARKRFAREGQAAAAVIDDNVMPIYSVAEWQGVPYLVTQYSRGATLQKRIQDQGPLELKEILRIGMQTARGLAAAQEGSDESGLGLWSVEADKLTVCLGERQKLPELRSRPEKLQRVNGTWFMELQRLKPGETVATLKPKAQARMQELTADLSRVIELPEGESARVGDLLAANAYRKLQK